ncbi:hypothetical protein M5K25_002861 [Dendrobium thyrsiflorum]|uniref:Uncharacterized protein n=1 Tax=Dendrobium thyrsiflorum TaxID=117978 RepID=A0ABD0VV39_DENTH
MLEEDMNGYYDGMPMEEDYPDNLSFSIETLFKILDEEPAPPIPNSLVGSFHWSSTCVSSSLSNVASLNFPVVFSFFLLSSHFLCCLLILPADYLNSLLLFGFPIWLFGLPMWMFGLPMVNVWFPWMIAQLLYIFLGFLAAGCLVSLLFYWFPCCWLFGFFSLLIPVLFAWTFP